MRNELLQFIPKNARTLGMLHDVEFRPDQAPRADPISDGRILFKQNKETFPDATLIRVPICLLTEGDSALIRQQDPNEALSILTHAIITTPTAAMILDAFSETASHQSIVWFCEDALYAKTVGRATGLPKEQLLPLFERQGDLIVELLGRIAKVQSGNDIKIEKLPFSNPSVMDAIREAISENAQSPGFNSKDRKKLLDSSAAVVASTHALFPDIACRIFGAKHTPAIQGPVHLETNPPHWRHIQELSTVVRFVATSTKRQNIPHKSLMPCIFEGEPIGEFSAFDVQSPQLRRDQRKKIDAWVSAEPLPLSRNPLFGHGIGLMETPIIQEIMKSLCIAEKSHDMLSGKKLQKQLGEFLDNFLDEIRFWL